MTWSAIVRLVLASLLASTLAGCSGAPEHLPGGKAGSEAAKAAGEDLGNALARPLTRSEVEKARGALEAAQRALEQFAADQSAYPEAGSCAELAGSLGPFGRNLAIAGSDPWGVPYECRVSADGFTLRSAGPDGVALSPDDIVIEGGSPL